MASHLSTKDRLLSIIDDMELIAKYVFVCYVVNLRFLGNFKYIIMLTIVLEK